MTEPSQTPTSRGDNARPRGAKSDSDTDLTIPWLWLGIGAVLFVFGVLGGLFLLRDGDTGFQTVASSGAERRVDPNNPGATLPPETTQPATETTPATEPTEPTEPTDVTPSTAPPATGSQPMRFSDGKMILAGTVRDQATADAFVAIAAEVVGAENVVEEYTVDPEATDVFDGRVVVDDPVLFASGSSDVQGSEWPALDLGLAALQASPEASVMISGHTDNIGDTGSNQVLSVLRARSVADYLVAQGADANRIDAEGFGEDNPVGDNATPEGRAQNRRIELIILDLA